MSEDNNGGLPPSLGKLPPLPPKKEAAVIQFEPLSDSSQEEADAASESEILSLYASVNSTVVFLRELAGKVAAGSVKAVAIAYDSETPDGDRGTRVLMGDDLVRLVGLIDVMKTVVMDHYMAALTYEG